MIIGVGTSTPELTVSFMGALNGNADVAIGNVVGSNIFNVLGILGITAMFFLSHSTVRTLSSRYPSALVFRFC